MRTLLAATAALALVACSDSSPDRNPGGSGGSAPSGGSGGGAGSAGSGGEGGGGAGGSAELPCSAPHVREVILVDRRDHLHAFDPAAVGAEPFEDLGALGCTPSTTPAPGFPEVIDPLALTVDRQGIVWLLYTTGEVFHVPLRDPGSCTPSGFVPGSVGTLLSLAFSADAPGGDTETLFSATGGPGSPGGQLGRIDVETLAGTNIGALDRAGDLGPLLSGDAAAHLFVLAPGITEMTTIREVSREDAKGVGPTRSLPSLDESSVALAIASWGGKHWVFRTRTVGPAERTSVTSIDQVTGDEATPITDAGATFLAAGSSTCAPAAP